MDSSLQVHEKFKEAVDTFPFIPKLYISPIIEWIGSTSIRVPLKTL